MGNDSKVLTRECFVLWTQHSSGTRARNHMPKSVRFVLRFFSYEATHFVTVHGSRKGISKCLIPISCQKKLEQSHL